MQRLLFQFIEHIEHKSLLWDISHRFSNHRCLDVRCWTQRSWASEVGRRASADRLGNSIYGNPNNIPATIKMPEISRQFVGWYWLRSDVCCTLGPNVTEYLSITFCFSYFFYPRRMEGLLWERDQERERQQLTIVFSPNTLDMFNSNSCLTFDISVDFSIFSVQPFFKQENHLQFLLKLRKVLCFEALQLLFIAMLPISLN